MNVNLNNLNSTGPRNEERRTDPSATLFSILMEQQRRQIEQSEATFGVNISNLAGGSTNSFLTTVMRQVRQLEESKEKCLKQIKQIAKGNFTGWSANPLSISYINPFTNPFLPPFIDPYNLIKTSRQACGLSEYAWFLNLALLKDAIKETNNPKTKELINFLINNYLDKCSSFSLGPDAYKEDYQIAPYYPVSYHRTDFLGSRFIHMDFPFNKQLALEKDSPLILTETDEIADFFPLYFLHVDVAQENWMDEFVEELSKKLPINSQTPQPPSVTVSSQIFSTPIPTTTVSTARALTISSTQSLVKASGSQQNILLPRILSLYPQNLKNIVNSRIAITINSSIRIPAQVRRRFESQIRRENRQIGEHLPAILFDLTALLAPYMKTNEMPDKEALFLEKLKEAQSMLDEAIEKAATACMATGLTKDAAKILLKEKITSVVRVKIETESGETIGGIKVIPLFGNTLYKSLLSTKHAKLVLMIQNTGVALSPVKMRKFVAQDYKLGDDVEYQVSGKNVRFFETPQAFLNLSLVKRLSEKFDAIETKQPHIAVLGKPTLKILVDLIQKWSSQDWETWNLDPAIRMIIQTSLYKIKEFLANAELSIHNHNDTQFGLCMELIHCELSALLEISSPYKKDDFSRIYKEKLIQYDILPKDLINMTKTRLNRNAMNTFTGLVASIKKHIPSALNCCSRGIYYEKEKFFRKTIQAVLSDADTPKIDLYVCQTNPNISIDPLITSYKEENIVENIKQLLALNAKSHTPLTVAIDQTIENFDSDKMRNIFSTFADEVKNGTLGFLVYHSGQKFDMLGQDNYYGSPYFLINNGDSKWDFANKLFSKEIYQTDSLSYQWFCLVYQDPSWLDHYRNLIFQNTKEIMKDIPDILKCDEKNISQKSLGVIEFDDNIQPCFIDIKFKGPNHYSDSIAVKERFKAICAKHRVKFFERASFGFNHYNLSCVQSTQCTSLRINPGLNPEKNFVMKELFAEIAALETLKHKKIELNASHIIDASTLSTQPSETLETNGFCGELYLPLPSIVVDKIKGGSWKEGCPVPLEDLAYLRVKHYDLKGQISTGEIIYHKNLAFELLCIFHELFEAKYPIDKMLLVDNYEVNDELSMKDNNTYAFCYRQVTGNSQCLSHHSLGCAIDLNPLLNPYIKNGVVLPQGGERYLDRSQVVPGLIQKDDACHQIFTKYGYRWGGDWQNKDYHHFEKIDRSFL